MSAKIVTEHVYPPIPIRSMDWAAHYDDPEGPVGRGSTEQEAIDDLLTNYPPSEISQLRTLALEMGRVIRALDEAGEHSEFWTQDGDYIIDGRFQK